MQTPTWDAWNQLERERQTEVAGRLGSHLPSGFRFREIREHAAGAVSQRVALFDGPDNSTFAFVPGGEVELGFDAANWQPDADEQESWDDTAAEYEIEPPLIEYLQDATTTTRTVELPALLVETMARELGWKPADVNDPEVKQLIKEMRRSRAQASTTVSGDRETRVTRDADGNLAAEVSMEMSHKSLSAELKKGGFRFPTSDEWEHLCGAGASTLFRWGDHAPCDRYPTDTSPDEAAWRRAWVLSGGKLEYPKEGFESDWSYHRQPNAFGLIIADNPYHCEVVADKNTTRGGDGGSVICGGAGFFVGWLTLATAYFEEHACIVDPDYGLSAGYTIGRRVLPLT